MPQISQSELNNQPVDQRKTFRERLMDRFAAHEWVRVINIDDEKFMWQYMPAHNETFNYTSTPSKETYREAPEAWMLEPGASEVIIGENAYVMIEGLYKKLVAKGYLQRNGEFTAGSPGRNFNWSDGKQAEDLIDKIYLGKETPSFKHESANAPEQPKPAATTGRLRATS